MSKLIIFSAPSGAGKTTVVRHLLDVIPSLAFSISATTRNKRDGEEDGKDYYFLSTEEFKNKIQEKKFIEYEQVYEGLFYGTLIAEIERLWSENKHVIFDVDVIGGINLKKHFNEKALSIFLKPPSIKSLEDRLYSRDSDEPNEIKKRLEKAASELKYEEEFDQVIVNDVLAHTFVKAERIVKDFLEE